ncbi:MAG: ribonuclease P protein component [Proteobacteria bacterium]|nr:ribonuclease P protein component [Pseudomonadota bacterium]
MRSDQHLTKITKSREYARLATQGFRFPSASWVILAAREDNQTPAVGIVASKKVGNAVVRNLAKRKMRALAREVLGSDKRLQGYKLVMIAKSRLLERDHQILKRELRYCVAEIVKQLQNTNDGGKQPTISNN